jgi:hypothetical protein
MTLIATGNGPSELTAPMASTNDFGCTATSIVVQSRLPETGDCSIQASIAVSSRNSATISMSDSHDVSDTSIIPSSDQSRTVTETFGVEGVNPSTDNRVLNYCISMRNLCSSMSDNARYQMG